MFIFIISIVCVVASKESYSFSIIGSRVLPVWNKKNKNRIVNVPLIPFNAKFILNKYTHLPTFFCYKTQYLGDLTVQGVCVVVGV